MATEKSERHGVCIFSVDLHQLCGSLWAKRVKIKYTISISIILNIQLCKQQRILKK